VTSQCGSRVAAHRTEEIQTQAGSAVCLSEMIVRLRMSEPV